MAPIRFQVVLATKITKLPGPSGDRSANNRSDRNDGDPQSNVAGQTNSGGLFKLGIRMGKETIKKYMWRVRKGLPPLNRTHTWATFVENHASGDFWACDFVQTYGLFFHMVFV